MKTNKEAQKKHNKEILKVVKSMKIKRFTILDGRVYCNGCEIDLSATNPDPLSIAYTTLKQIYG